MRGPLTMRALVAATLLASVGVTAFGRQERRDKPIRFGDAVLSNYRSAELVLGSVARAKGPDTTVEFGDPKQGARARLMADSITATMATDPTTRKNEVARVEVEGNVRFDGRRPTADGKGTSEFRGVGTKGVYLRAKGVMQLSGPVTFEASQPSADGKGIETVKGRADSAEYDEAEKSLSLHGDVSATVVTPDTPPEGSSFDGIDDVRIDMSKRPYRVFLDNASRQGKVQIRLNSGGR